MKHTSLVTTVGAFVILLSVQAAWSADGPGSSGAGYLMLPVGPRTTAMGDAKAAMTEYPFGWLVNPASLETLGRGGIGALHSEWIMDTRYDNLCGHLRINDWLTVGGGITYQYNSDIQGYDALGMETELLDNYNYQGLVGLGFTPARSFSAGVNLKYFRETLHEWSAGGFGIDIGALYIIEPLHASVGLAVQNLGPDVKFIDLEEPLPMTVRGGAAYTLDLPYSNLSMAFAADAVKPRFEDAYLSAGCEVTLFDLVSVRGGYCGQESRAGDGITFGAGVRIGTNVFLDYSSTPYGDLGIFHMISVHLGL